MIEEVCDENPNSNSFDLGCYNSLCEIENRKLFVMIEGIEEPSYLERW